MNRVRLYSDLGRCCLRYMLGWDETGVGLHRNQIQHQVGLGLAMFLFSFSLSFSFLSPSYSVPVIVRVENSL